MVDGTAGDLRVLLRSGVLVLVAGLIALFSGGCRETAPAPTEATVPQGLRFSVGDSLTFDAWELDAYGDLVSSSHRVVLWDVVSTDDTFGGAEGVTTIIESATGSPPDTLHFQFRTDGAVYQYGYLAQVEWRREHKQRTPQWDLLQDRGVGVGAGWLVGTLDSAGTEDVYGMIEGTSYFSSKVNGQPVVFSGETSSLESDTFFAEISLSSDPSVVLRLFEDSSPSTSGYLWTLATATLHQ
jgi:hypothetical protein